MLACQDAATRDYALTRPRSLPDEPLPLSRAVLEAAAADYDRLTGGRLAEHAAASPPAQGSELGRIRSPGACCACASGSTCRTGAGGIRTSDALAALYVTALHHLMLCWGQHPLLARLAAPLAQPDRFIRTMTGFAAAKLLFDAGNRVGFLPVRRSDVDLHFTTAADEPLSLALLAPELLQWRERDAAQPRGPDRGASWMRWPRRRGG